MNDDEMRRLTRALELLTEMMRDDWRRAERIHEENRLVLRELMFKIDAIRANDLTDIADKLRVVRADAEKAALELDRATLDRLRKQKWAQEQETGISTHAIDPKAAFPDEITASGHGVRASFRWGSVWTYGKWIVVGGGGWLIHHIQQWLHIGG